MTLVALDTPALRQAIVSGRVADAITGAGLDVHTAELHYNIPAISSDWVAFPAQFCSSTGGWFSFQSDPWRTALEFVGIAQVNLRVRFGLIGRPEAERIVLVDTDQLRTEDANVTIGGKPAVVKRIPGAPFEFSLSLDPAPVALAGYVLRDNDPAAPAPSASVSILDPASATTATTDASGWFRLDALPLANTVTIRAADGGNTVDQVVHPDFSKPVNETVLSVSTG